MQGSSLASMLSLVTVIGIQINCSDKNSKGYDNIPWGSTLSEVQQIKGPLQFVGQDQTTVIYAVNLKITSYNYEIDYVFNKSTGKLMQVYIMNPGKKKLSWVDPEHAIFLKSLIQQYGNPSDTRQEGDGISSVLVYTWNVGQTEIKLIKNNDMFQEGNFTVLYSSFRTGRN